jgi:hypothetical protein
MNLMNSNATAIMPEQLRVDALMHVREFALWASDPGVRRGSLSQFIIEHATESPQAPPFPSVPTSLGISRFPSIAGEGQSKGDQQGSRRSQELGRRFEGIFPKIRQNIGGLARTGHLFAIVHFGLAGFCRDDSERMKDLRIELMDPLVENYHGCLVNAVDGALLGMFASALEATRCAVDVQRRLSGYEYDQRGGD